MKPNNPFLISGYYSPEYFCDRQKETATILDALENGRNVTLIAPRRMGKTGLIRHAFYNLKEQHPEIVTLYMDIYATQTLGDFVRLFANTVLGTLDSVPQKALSRVAQFIRSCRPAITFDELSGIPKITIDVMSSEEKSNILKMALKPFCAHIYNFYRTSTSSLPAASSTLCSRCLHHRNVRSTKVHN
jgi:hypothetical protein